jgi:hypothetical protein
LGALLEVLLARSLVAISSGVPAHQKRTCRISACRRPGEHEPGEIFLMAHQRDEFVPGGHGPWLDRPINRACKGSAIREEKTLSVRFF